MKWRSIRRAAAPVVIVFAWAAVPVGCGFDGGATRDLQPAPNDAAAARDVSSDGPSVGRDDAGHDADGPTLTCSDPALSFDGIDDAALVAQDDALELAGNFTVEAWIKPSERATTDVEMDVVSHHDSGDAQGWVLLVRNGHAEIVVYGTEFLMDARYSAGSEGLAYVVPGKWAHVAATRKGATLRLYYDGILRGSQTLPGTFVRAGLAGPLRFGRGAVSTDFPYQGELDDVRLSKRARYVNDTAPRPTAPLPVDADTVALWRFDEAGGGTLTDASNGHHDGALASDATAASRVGSTCIAER